MKALIKHSLALLALLASFNALAAGEPPYLQARIDAGLLPALNDRLPDAPSVTDAENRSIGQYGGSLRLLMAKSKDIRMMTVYGYSRLVALDNKLQLRPDILLSLDNEENRIFTLHLRKGHRWSDGHLFTAEDFRFYWEDVANFESLSPYGPPQTFKVDGKLPEFTVIDEHTVRFSWDTPNPHFLPAIAGPSPLYLYRPSHYLKQFHPRFISEEQLERQVKELNSKNWRKLFLNKGRQYKFTNPELPSLQPWVNTTRIPAERFVFKRNPYFHRVDATGQQLPYIDEVIIQLASASLIPAKAGSGESDLQARYLSMDDYTFLKSAEQDTKNVRVLLWDTALGSQIALYPNLNAADPVWRKIMQDVRFRRAMSLAIDRHELNQVIYFGLARESANTVLPNCELFDPMLKDAWASFDIEKANALLDDMGLKRGRDGIRRLPNGEHMDIVVQTAGESTEQTDMLELIKDTWYQVGIRLYTKALQREVLRNRVFSGQALMSVWMGLPNGIPTAEMSPASLAPTRQDQLQWPAWGRHAETGEGEAPSLIEVQKLAALNEQWTMSKTSEERLDIWNKMLRIHADQVYSIGLINGTLQPVVINPRLRNVPEKAVYNWDPGSFFGIHRFDTFWLRAEDAS